MAKRRQVSVEFPLAGLNRRSSYQKQPPYSTPDCLNVRAVATLEGRERGGSRPGLCKSHIDNLGGPICLLAPMTLALGDSFSSWSDNFSGTSMSAVWTVASWADSLPLILPYAVASIDTSVDEAAAILDTLPIDTSQPYTVEMYLVPWEGAWHGKYRLYLRLNDNSLDNGVLIELTQTGSTGVYTASLKSYDGGDETEVDTATGVIIPSVGWLSATVYEDDVTVYWNGIEIMSGTVDDTHTGTLVGFGMSCTVDGGLCLVNTFRAQYYSVGEYPALRSMLIASAEGNLYTETTYGRMTDIESDLTLRDNTLLLATQSGQELFIADYGDVIAIGTNGVITTGVLTDAGVNWETSGLTDDNIVDYVVVISHGTPDSVIDTYKITSVDGTDLILTNGPDAGTACTYRIERAPKVFTPATGILSLMVATDGVGQVPTGCPLICRYLDRIMLAGAEIAPHVWYMSRQSNPLDWDYSQEDSQRAVAGTASAAGVPGEPITALIPHSDDYLIIACRNSLWRLLGDPAYEGSMSAVSHTVGVIGPKAWCLGPGGELIFLSLDGLYALPPGGETYPIALSREVLPREFLNLNPDMLTVLLEYDVQGGGVHIYLTPVSSNARIHWWFDWGRKTFWPVSLDADHEPTATCAVQSVTIEDSGVILGGRDGTLRRLSDLAENDCGETYETYVVIGPIKLAQDGSVGILNTIDANMADGSGPVTWKVTPGQTYEDAINNDYSDTGTWNPGLNGTVYPACRGQAFSLEIIGTEGRKWAIENIVTTARDGGKRRIS